MRRQQFILFGIWIFFLVSTLLFLFAVIMTGESVSGEDSTKIWKWFGTVSGPILVGMTATFIAEEKLKIKSKPPAGRFLFFFCVAFVIFYWMLVFTNIVSWGGPDKTEFADWLEDTQGYLAIIQTSLFLLLGYFFVATKSA